MNFSSDLLSNFHSLLLTFFALVLINILSSSPRAPQNTNEFYLGTSFLNVVFPTFNYDEDTITLARKFNIDSPVNGVHLDDNYRLPLIIVGSVLALLSVIALLAILKKVKVDDG